MGLVENSRRTMYDVLWDTSYNLGYLDDVKPEIAMLLAPIKIGSLGNVKVGERFIGLEDGAKITLLLRETTRANFQKLAPWATQTAGAELVITPPVNTDLYTYARPLLLHPRDKGSGVGSTDQDLELYKTVPIKAFELPRTGTDEDKWSVEFLIYPDRAVLPVLSYGRLKA